MVFSVGGRTLYTSIEWQLMEHIYEIIFAACIAMIADWQAHIINNQKPINHFWWGVLFAGLIGIGFVVEKEDYWFLAALILEHFILFAPLLNFFRSPRKPFFYISSNPKQGSIWDRLLLKIEKYYPYLYIASGVVFIYLQFKL